MSSTDLIILRELIAREPEHLSGSELARQLGISRVAVWQHMGKLRSQGFAFEAAHAKGYRITQRPMRLHQAYIEALLSIRQNTLPIHIFDDVSSTNDEAARLLTVGEPGPFVVLARRQTKGRGRLGRVWHSHEHANLYSSFAFRPGISPERMSTFTLCMGVAVCELIQNFCGLHANIKWPNDIVFGRRKVGGMLTEARIDADQIRDLVFGLGLNVNMPDSAWPPHLADRATSLSAQAGHPLDFNRFVAALIGRVHLTYRQFIDGDHKPAFVENWQQHDVLRDEPVVVLQGTRRIAGIAHGIDDTGSLLIRDDSGKLHHFAAGEVTLEKTASLAPTPPRA